MATPRVFISSTCYDLHELRFQLRKFISDIGYEPVMSEFGDIFYDLKDHVQEGCKNEIERCEMFVLIIGNNYGSIYHRHEEGVNLPDSVTLQEFRKALEVKIPKFIFLNRFVQHDFENYRKALTKVMRKYFNANDVEKNEIESHKSKIKSDFDESYPFPQDTYKYIFYFIEKIYDLDINNAVFPFESFDDIRDSLRKQWAGYFYDKLKTESTVPLEKVLEIEKKIDRVESQLRIIAETGKKSGGGGKLTIDISKLTFDIDIKDLANFQKRIHSLLHSILYYNLSQKRIQFSTKFTKELVSKFFNNLNQVVNQFKWSVNIPVVKLFIHVPYKFWESREDIPYGILLELNSIANSLTGDDKEKLINTIILEFDKSYVKPPAPQEFDSPPFNPTDDIPF